MRFHKPLAIILSALSFLFFPVFPFLLMGAVGDYPLPSWLLMAGYLIFTISAFIGIWKKRALYGCLLAAALFATGHHLDSTFWQEHNSNLCTSLRHDTHCIETETGFECVEPSIHGNMNAGIGICNAPLTPQERESANKKKRAAQIKDAAEQGTAPVKKIADSHKVMKAINRYEEIARTITSSRQPGTLDFETDLVAIYNCLAEQYEDNVKGEIMASNVLARLATSIEEKNRYTAYTASKGRYMNPSLIAAGLPAGDQTLGCHTIP